MKFKCFKRFQVRALGNLEPINVPIGAELIRRGDILYYNGIPVCTWRSLIAKEYLVWDGDGMANQRLQYENIILFNPREKTWSEIVYYIDPKDGVEKEKTEEVSGRFSPDEAEYMMENFSQFFHEDARFNDYFYVGSHIQEVKALADYLFAEQ